MDALLIDYYTSPNVWRNHLPDYRAHAYERYQQGWYEDEKRSCIERFLIDIHFKNVMRSFCTFFHLTNICLKERTLHAGFFSMLLVRLPNLMNGLHRLAHLIREVHVYPLASAEIR